MRRSNVASGMETELHDRVRAWLKNDWPSANAVFPGTDSSWDDWEAVEEVKR